MKIAAAGFQAAQPGRQIDQPLGVHVKTSGISEISLTRIRLYQSQVSTYGERCVHHRLRRKP
jgi:hypothetical protein